MPTATVGPEFGIQDVWASNLEEEFRKIRQVVQKYNFVAMVGSNKDVFYISFGSFSHITMPVQRPYPCTCTFNIIDKIIEYTE